MVLELATEENNEVGKEVGKMQEELQNGVCWKDLYMCWNKLEENGNSNWIAFWKNSGQHQQVLIHVLAKGKTLRAINSHMDDILVTCSNHSIIKFLGQYLSQKYEMKDWGEAKYCFVLFVLQQRGQRGYRIAIILKKAMLDSNPWNQTLN